MSGIIFSDPLAIRDNAPQKRRATVNGYLTGRHHKRSRSGCYTCRLRRKKCDESHPSCLTCNNLCVKCEYERPEWWSSPEQRKIHKERVKNKIKQTKLNEKNQNALLGRQSRPTPLGTPCAPEFNFNRPYYTEAYDPFASHLPTPAFPPPAYGQFPPYEVDVRTERQLFVNDVQTRVDTSFSTFSTFAPPQLHPTLPNFPETEWIPHLSTAPIPQNPSTNGAIPFHDPSRIQSHLVVQMNIPVDDCDRPLLNHFVDNVLKLIFPIAEAHQGGLERARAVLHSLENNKSYLHCCLSVAAIHLKSTIGIEGEVIDHDILRHRFEAISQLCQSLNEDAEHEKILEATLAMIFFHCSVGGPDDHLPDIAWNDHFHAATSLINKLDLPNALLQSNGPYKTPPFNMTLASWIDILGSTMICKTPQFSHTYRSKHLSGTPSGLRELMGCDDRVMYLISEIACLDALRAEGAVNDMAVCSHVHALGQQLEYTEPLDKTLETPYHPVSGAIRPELLTKNITAAFRIAARIYLCSLIPGFDRNQASTINLVNAVTEILRFIPGGPEGYDRPLVWPLLITGAFSVSTSSFRQVLHQRVIEMGDSGDFGSFGRAYRLLLEVWHVVDDPVTPVSGGFPSDPESKEGNITSPLTTPPMREIKKRSVHWRDIMKSKGWKYLLI